MRLKRIFGVAICGILIIAGANKSNAAHQLTVDNRNPFDGPKLIRCTCYTADEGAITSSGKAVRTGIIAGKSEWQGCVALLYSYKYVDGQPVPMELIGIYEVLDTGAGIDTDGDGEGDSIRNGTSVDVFQPTLHQAEEWVDTYGDYVMMQLVEGKG